MRGKERVLRRLIVWAMVLALTVTDAAADAAAAGLPAVQASTAGEAGLEGYAAGDSSAGMAEKDANSTGKEEENTALTDGGESGNQDGDGSITGTESGGADGSGEGNQAPGSEAGSQGGTDGSGSETGDGSTSGTEPGDADGAGEGNQAPGSEAGSQGGTDGSGSETGNGSTPGTEAGGTDGAGEGTQAPTATLTPEGSRTPEEDFGEDEDFSDLMPIEELTALPEDMVGATMWRGAAVFAMAMPGEGAAAEPGEDVRPKGEDWDFGIRYSYQTDTENHMVITDNANIKYDMAFHTDTGLPAGTVEIRIPMKLFRYRGTVEEGNYNKAEGILVVPAENDIAVPRAPKNDDTEWTYSRNTPFNYYISETDENGSPTENSELVFFNYRKVSAGTNAMWQVLYRNVDIMQSVDGTEWKLQAQAAVVRKNTVQDTERPENPPVESAWKELAVSEELTGKVDSSVNITAVTKKAYKESGKQFTPGLYTEAQVENYISGKLPEEFRGENFNKWKYMVWEVTVNGNATQPWNMELAENPGILKADGTEKVTDASEFRVVGYRNNTSSAYPLGLEEGKTFTAQGEGTGKTLEATVKENCTERNPRMRFYVVTAYPADQVETGTEETADRLENRLTVTFLPVDEGSEPSRMEKSDSASYKDYQWTYRGDTIGVSKYSDQPNETKKNYGSWLEAYSQAQGAGQDYGSLWFSSRSSFTGYGLTHYISQGENGALHSYREGSCYELATVDDFLYAGVDGANDKKPFHLDWNDYYYSAVTVTQTDKGYDSAREEETSTLEFPEEDHGVYIYAMFGKPETAGAEWTDVQKNTWVPVNDGNAVMRTAGGNTVSYSLTREEIAREPWRIMAVHRTAEHTTYCTIDVEVRLKAEPSAELQAVMDAYRDGKVKSLELRNFAAALGRSRGTENGEWKELVQTESGSLGAAGFYKEFDPEFGISSATTAFYREKNYDAENPPYTFEESNMPVRGSASVTLYGLEKEARSYKRAKATNDVASGRVLVDYFLTAYDGYEVSDSEVMGYLRNMGVDSPGRKYVMFYDLLPYGLEYDPSAEVVAGRLTRLDTRGEYRERTNYWDEKDVTVATEVTADWNGTGRDMVVFRLEYAGDDPSVYTDGKWLEGWGVSFRAYYAWSAKEQVEKQYNISAFMPDVEKYPEGADLALRGGIGEAYADGSVPETDPERQITGVYGLFAGGINPENKGGEANVLYACCPVKEDQATSSGSVIHKEVRPDADTFLEYGDSAYVGEGKGYTYKITVETPQTGLKDLVVFDHLENAAEERAAEKETDDPNQSRFGEGEKWYGTFRGIGFAGLEGYSVKPTVWYNAARNADTTTWEPAGSDGLAMNRRETELSVDEVLTAANGWYEAGEFIKMYRENGGEELEERIAQYRDSLTEGELASLLQEYRKYRTDAGKEGTENDAITWALAMETVGSVAVDLRKTQEGDDFVLPSRNAISFEIRMRAPRAGEAGEDAGEIPRYAFNNPSYYSSPEGAGQGKTLEGDSVYVCLGTGSALEVRKEFADPEKVPEKVTNESFRFRVYRETEKRDADGNIVRDENGNAVMVPEPLANKEYTLWNRVAGEDGAEDSYVQVKDRPYAADEQGYFTLKAGQRAVFENVADAEHVKVEEEERLCWKADSICYSNQEYPDNNKISGLDTYLHVIRNTYRNVLYVQKKLAGVPEDVKNTLTDADKTFTFRIRVKDESGEYQPASLEYCLADSVKLNGYSPEILEFPEDAADTGGNTGDGKFRRTGEDGQFEIREGWIIALLLDEENAEYELTETYPEKDGKPYGGDWLVNDTPVTGTVPWNGASEVITNVYKWKDLYLVKKVTHQDPEDCTEIFTFELQKRQKVEEKDENGIVTGTKWEWIPVDGSVDGNTWILLEGDEENDFPEEWAETGSGAIDGNGRFSVQCAGKVVQITKLEAGAAYRIMEVPPEGADDWDYLPGQMQGGEFVAFGPGEGLEVTIPVYGDRTEETIVNEYLRRSLSVTKTVLSDETVDAEFTMVLARGTAESCEFLGNQPYIVLENGMEAGYPAEQTTDAQGCFKLKSGQTAVFENLGKEGERFVVWEVQEEHNGKLYPQLSPAVVDGGEKTLTLGSGAVTVGAPLEVALGAEGGSGEFLNGTPGLLVIGKEYESGNWHGEGLLDEKKNNLTSSQMELIGAWEFLAQMEAQKDSAVGEDKNEKQELIDRTLALIESIRRMPESYRWGDDSLDVRISLTVNGSLWQPESGDSITCIDRLSGQVYRIGYGPDGAWKLERQVPKYVCTAPEQPEFAGYVWREEGWDADVALAFHNGSFNIKPWMSYVINVGENTEYRVEETDPFHADLEEQYVVSPKVPEAAGNTADSPVATLCNEVSGWDNPAIEKRLTPGSAPVGTGKNLVWRLEKYNALTGNWNAAEGVAYIVLEGDDENRYCSSSAVRKTGRDGKIVLSRDRDENTYLAVQFLLKDGEGLGLNMEAGNMNGEFRVTELLGPDSGTDGAWGTLVGYSREDLNGRYDMQLGGEDVTIIVNSNQETRVRIEKRTEKNYNETFTMFLRQKSTLGEGYYPVKGIRYEVYDAASGEYRRDGETGTDGEIRLEDGQYAELFLPADAEWAVSEAEGNDPGARQDFILNKLQKEKDPEGILFKSGRNEMLIRHAPVGMADTFIVAEDVMGVGSVTAVIWEADGGYRTEQISLQGETVEIPEYILQNNIVYHVTGIGEGAFAYMGQMREITIPPSVHTIENSAFMYCSGLTGVEIPEGVTRIEDQVFAGCESLTDVSIPGTVTSIGEGAFRACPGITKICADGWNGNGVLVLPDSIKEIGDGAFQNCTLLSEAELGSVEVIGAGAFNNCASLESIILPETLEQIGADTFNGCSSLKKVTVLSNMRFVDYAGNETATADMVFGTGRETVETLIVDAAAVGNMGQYGKECFPNLKYIIVKNGQVVQEVKVEGSEAEVSDDDVKNALQSCSKLTINCRMDSGKDWFQECGQFSGTLRVYFTQKDSPQSKLDFSKVNENCKLEFYVGWSDGGREISDYFTLPAAGNAEITYGWTPDN